MVVVAVLVAAVVVAGVAVVVAGVAVVVVNEAMRASSVSICVFCAVLWRMSTSICVRIRRSNSPRSTNCLLSSASSVRAAGVCTEPPALPLAPGGRPAPALAIGVAVAVRAGDVDGLTGWSVDTNSRRMNIARRDSLREGKTFLGQGLLHHLKLGPRTTVSSSRSSTK